MKFKLSICFCIICIFLKNVSFVKTLKPQSHRIVRFCDRTIGCDMVSYDRSAMFAAISFYNRTLWYYYYYYYLCISGSPDRSTHLGSYTWVFFCFVYLFFIFFYICISFSIFVILVDLFLICWCRFQICHLWLF